MCSRQFGRTWGCVLLLVGVFAPGSFADDPSFPLLVGFDRLLAAERGANQPAPQSAPAVDPEVLIDVRPRAEYAAEHIRGAIWVDANQAQAIAARPGGLTDRAAWAQWIAPLGLTQDSRVRVIDGARQLEAARIWWLLRYLGVARVGLIDGNFNLWKAQQRPTTNDVTAVVPHPFPIEFQADRLANRVDVLAILKDSKTQIVDARSAEEWSGSKLLSQRGGHIPTACRVEWAELVDQQGRFLSRDQLKARLDRAGIKPGGPVVTHCQGGGRASVDAFVCELLGYPTRNFYLGWSDWGNAEETPVTTTDEPESGTKPAMGGAAAPQPFVVEYYYTCEWGRAEEFLALFQKNHLPVLRERIKQGDILKLSMTKPRIHTSEAARWDYRVTIEFRDAASAFAPELDEPIKRRLFPDQVRFRAEEQRRFEILGGHTDLPIEAVDLDQSVKAP